MALAHTTPVYDPDVYAEGNYDTGQFDPEVYGVLAEEGDTEANAGAATGTGAAGTASPSIAPNAGAASGTGSAFDATISTAANAQADAEAATGTGAANGPTISLAPNGGAAGGTGAAGGPASSVGPAGGNASGTGAAFNPTITITNDVSAEAGVAAGTGSAYDAVIDRGVENPPPLDGGDRSDYVGLSKAVHVLDGTTETIYPDVPVYAEPHYTGRGSPAYIHADVPSLSIEDFWPSYVFQHPVYRGRSQMIHVHNPNHVPDEPPDPIPSCRCCAEECNVDCEQTNYDDFDRTSATTWNPPWSASASDADVVASVDGEAGILTVTQISTDVGGSSETWRVIDSGGPWATGADEFVLTARVYIEPSLVPTPDGNQSADFGFTLGDSDGHACNFLWGFVNSDDGPQLSVAPLFAGSGSTVVALAPDGDGWYLVKWHYQKHVVSEVKIWPDDGNTPEPADYLASNQPNQFMHDADRLSFRAGWTTISTAWGTGFTADTKLDWVAFGDCVEVVDPDAACGDCEDPTESVSSICFVDDFDRVHPLQWANAWSMALDEPPGTFSQTAEVDGVSAHLRSRWNNLLNSAGGFRDRPSCGDLQRIQVDFTFLQDTPPKPEEDIDIFGPVHGVTIGIAPGIYEENSRGSLAWSYTGLFVDGVETTSAVISQPGGQSDTIPGVAHIRADHGYSIKVEIDNDNQTARMKLWETSGVEPDWQANIFLEDPVDKDQFFIKFIQNGLAGEDFFTTYGEMVVHNVTFESVGSGSGDCGEDTFDRTEEDGWGSNGIFDWDTSTPHPNCPPELDAGCQEAYVEDSAGQLLGYGFGLSLSNQVRAAVPINPGDMTIEVDFALNHGQVSMTNPNSPVPRNGIDLNFGTSTVAQTVTVFVHQFVNQTTVEEGRRLSILAGPVIGTGDTESFDSLLQADTPYTLKVEISGFDVRAKLWLANEPEPGAWGVEAVMDELPEFSTLRISLDVTDADYDDDRAHLKVYRFYNSQFGDDCGEGEPTFCDECEDPANPGFLLPDFTPGYLPIFRKQIGDPTTNLDSFICTMESGAMALDWHTRGAVQVWGGELIPWSGRTEASILGSGTNLNDVQQAWLHWGQSLSVRSGQTWANLTTCLNEGRAVILQGDYDQLTAAEKCQAGFEDNHAILVLPYIVSGRLLIADPLCNTFHGVSAATIQAYAEDFGAQVFGATSPQKILFAVTQPWAP